MLCNLSLVHHDGRCRQPGRAQQRAIPAVASLRVPGCTQIRRSFLLLSLSFFSVPCFFFFRGGLHGVLLTLCVTASMTYHVHQAIPPSRALSLFPLSFSVFQLPCLHLPWCPALACLHLPWCPDILGKRHAVFELPLLSFVPCPHACRGLGEHERSSSRPPFFFCARI